jgi:hypothetical protein
VLLASRRESLGEAVAADIRAVGGDATFAQADVRQAEDHFRLADLALAIWGAARYSVQQCGHLACTHADRELRGGDLERLTSRAQRWQ